MAERTIARIKQYKGLYRGTQQEALFYVPLPIPTGEESIGKICHENDDCRGWNFKNTATQKNEICTCPIFEEANMVNKLTDYENNLTALTGKIINELKHRSIAGTLLHELTHA
jgi:hypothetical protein